MPRKNHDLPEIFSIDGDFAQYAASKLAELDVVDNHVVRLANETIAEFGRPDPGSLLTFSPGSFLRSVDPVDTEIDHLSKPWPDMNSKLVGIAINGFDQVDPVRSVGKTNRSNQKK